MYWEKGVQVIYFLRYLYIYPRYLAIILIFKYPKVYRGCDDGLQELQSEILLEPP